MSLSESGRVLVQEIRDKAQKILEAIDPTGEDIAEFDSFLNIAHARLNNTEEMLRERMRSDSEMKKHTSFPRIVYPRTEDPHPPGGQNE